MFLEATVVHFDALPLIVRQSLVASLRGHGSPTPTLAAASARPPPHLDLALLLISAAAVSALVVADPAVLGRGPGLLAVAVGGAVALVAVARLVGRWLATRRLPWPAGQYVLGAYLVDATTAVLRVESAMAVTATEVIHHRVDGAHQVTTIDIWTRDHVYRFAVERREAAQGALDRLETDLVAMIEALREGEVEAVARLDPLFEVRGDDRLSPVAPVVRPRAPPRLGWRWPRAPPPRPENADARRNPAGATESTR